MSANLKKILALFTKSQKKRTINIVLILVVGAILEMFSIGLIVPLIGIMVNGSLKNTLFFNDSYYFIESLSSEELTIYGMLFLVCAYTLKSLYLGVSAFYQSNYIYDIQQSISSRLVKRYILAPYTFHLQNNPSKLINNVINEVNLFSINVTIPLNIILSELLVVIALLLLLLFYEPLGALIVIVFLIGSSFLFYMYMRKNIAKWGRLRQGYDEKRLKSLQEALYGSKEIRILGKEYWFANVFSESNKGSARIQAIQRSFLQLPRLIIEVLAISALLLLILVMTLQDMQSDQMMMVIGLFAAISFRIAPSINKVLVSFQEMRYASSIIDMLHSELTSYIEVDPNVSVNHKGSISPIPFDKSLVFSQVDIGYTPFKSLVLSSINLSIYPGEFIGIMGGSGSGKTTFLNLILGLIPPLSGSVKIDGVDMHLDVSRWQLNIGYVPQSVYLIDDSIKSNVAFGVPPEEIDETALQDAINMSGLGLFVQQVDRGVDALVGDRGANLSGGQIQRIGIARALYNKPSVLVLDESTSALDSETERNFLDTIKTLKGKLTIVFVTHKPSSIAFCDRVFDIDNGELTERVVL